MPQAIHISPIDNVVVALHPIAKGTLVEMDGLVVTATDDEICRAVCAGKSAEESLDDLIALAKAQGAPDNVTAVLIEHE